MYGFFGQPRPAGSGFSMGAGPSGDLTSLGMAPVDMASIAAFGQPGGAQGMTMGTTMPTMAPAQPGGFGLNMDTARLGLAGIGTIGNLWGAFQAANLAKKQFNFTKDVTNTNIANQIKTFNSGLTDRANNRAIVEGRSAAETAAYIDANKLARFGRG